MKHTDNIAAVAERLIVTSVSGVSVDKDGRIQVRCPKCLAWKELIEGFGVRYFKDDNVLRNQSWCRDCRREGLAETP